MKRVTAIGRVGLAASALSWLLVPRLRDLVEGSMGLHMVLQFPLLLAAGWAASAWCQERVASVLARVDVNGVASATLASLVAAFWMIPSALDLALLELRWALLKYLSWILAGLLLGQGWRRLSPALMAFFCGNAAWMLMTAGLLYRDAESRLCISYLIDEQAVAGHGLFAWGLLLGVMTLCWLWVLTQAADQAADAHISTPEDQVHSTHGVTQ